MQAKSSAVGRALHQAISRSLSGSLRGDLEQMSELRRQLSVEKEGDDADQTQAEKEANDGKRKVLLVEDTEINRVSLVVLWAALRSFQALPSCYSVVRCHGKGKPPLRKIRDRCELASFGLSSCICIVVRLPDAHVLSVDSVDSEAKRKATEGFTKS